MLDEAVNAGPFPEGSTSKCCKIRYRQGVEIKKEKEKGYEEGEKRNGRICKEYTDRGRDRRRVKKGSKTKIDRKWSGKNNAD
jgi:hypothetical protein